ncbi:MAG: peptide chain release factor [uncultured bacterium]|nr:MAG: peptide chain release factor [uncultured bacterium]
MFIPRMGMPSLMQVHGFEPVAFSGASEFSLRGSSTCYVSSDTPNCGGGVVAGQRSTQQAHVTRGVFRSVDMINLPGVSHVKLLALSQRFATLGIDEKDIIERFIRGSGKGGQKINKTSNCVQLVHTPTGRCIRCQQSRDRNENRYLARCSLADQIENEMTSALLKQARQTHIKQVAERVRLSHLRRKVERFG